MKYERITKRNGVCVGINQCENRTCYFCTKQGKCKTIYEALDRLAELEDKIEDGRLVELPRKIRDTVYIVEDGEVFEGWVDRLCQECYDDDFDYLVEYDDGAGLTGYWVNECGVQDRIFSTRAEAEAKLKELRG